MINRIGQTPLKTVLFIFLGLPFLGSWLGNAFLSYQRFETALDISKADPNRKELLNTLEELGSLPRLEKKETLLFIPQSNRLYWSWYKNCKATPFLAPAITGIASLDGLPAADCEATFYGYPSYKLRSPDQPILKASDTILICQATEERGFTKVIVLDTDKNQGIKVRSLDCRN